MVSESVAVGLERGEIPTQERGKVAHIVIAKIQVVQLRHVGKKGEIRQGIRSDVEQEEIGQTVERGEIRGGAVPTDVEIGERDEARERREVGDVQAVKTKPLEIAQTGEGGDIADGSARRAAVAADVEPVEIGEACNRAGVKDVVPRNDQQAEFMEPGEGRKISQLRAVHVEIKEVRETGKRRAIRDGVPAGVQVGEFGQAGKRGEIGQRIETDVESEEVAGGIQPGQIGDAAEGRIEIGEREHVRPGNVRGRKDLQGIADVVFEVRIGER